MSTKKINGSQENYEPLNVGFSINTQIVYKVPLFKFIMNVIIDDDTDRYRRGKVASPLTGKKYLIKDDYDHNFTMIKARHVMEVQ